MDPKLRSKLVDLLCQVPRLKSREGRDAWLSISLPSNIYEFLNRKGQSCKDDLTLIFSQIEETRLINGEWCLLNLIDQALIDAHGLAVEQELRAMRHIISKALANEGEATVILSGQPPSYEELIIGKDEKLPVAFLYEGSKAALAVARIRVPSTLGGYFTGTAWLIAPGLAITNHHVINARDTGEPPPSMEELQAQAMGSTLWFEYEEGKQHEEFACEGLIESDIDLDYAILNVREKSLANKSINDYGYLRIVTVQPALPRGARLNVIQHPGGRSKEVAMRSNYFLGSNVGSNRIYYLTDTESGSSGSPVMDDLWHVLALHRGWDHYEKYYQGQSIRFSSLGLQYAEDPKLSKDSVAFMNEGVTIHAILKNIKEETRRAILTAQPWLA